MAGIASRMLIIDLDAKKTAPILPKSEKQPVFAPKIEEKPTQKAEKPKAEPTDQKERLLRKLEEEDRYIRHMRALNHQKFFDLLGPELTPVRGADFSEIYAEQKVFRERLKDVFLKKEQIEKTGTLNQPKYLTDSELALLGALKHDRGNAYKLINKLNKKLEEAKVKSDDVRVSALEQKIEQIRLKVLQYSHEIEKITNNGMVTR